MSRWVVGAFVLLSVGVLLARKAHARKHIELPADELTLEQLFSGEVPEHVKRTFSANKEKKG